MASIRELLPESQIAGFLETTGLNDRVMSLPIWLVISTRENGEITVFRRSTFLQAMKFTRSELARGTDFVSHTIALEFGTCEKPTK